MAAIRQKVERKPGKQRAIGYGRGSTIGQEKYGHTLQVQLKEWSAYCRGRGYAFNPKEDWYTDLQSGGRTDRSGFHQFVARIETDTGVHVGGAYDLSRFGRNSFDTALLMAKAKDNGIRLETVTEGGRDFCADPISELLYDLVCAVEKYRRTAIVTALTKKKRDHFNDRAAWVSGNAPYGYKIVGRRANKTLEVDPEKAPVVRRVFEEYAAGGTQKGIAQGLTRGEIPGPAGGRWSTEGIRYMLENETYIGWLSYGEERVRGAHVTLIDQGLWKRVQMRREERAKKWPGRPRKAA